MIAVSIGNMGSLMISLEIYSDIVTVINPAGKRLQIILMKMAVVNYLD